LTHVCRVLIASFEPPRHLENPMEDIQTPRAGPKLILKFAPDPTLMRRERSIAATPRARRAERPGTSALKSGSSMWDRIVSGSAGCSQIGQVKNSPDPFHPVVSSPRLPGADGKSESAR
jgi:hypothetical protein